MTSAGRLRGRRIALTALWAATGSLLLSGCGFQGLYDVPLPGGAAMSGDTYTVTVEFRDVLDLVPRSAVKVDNVTVGTVEELELDGWQARARLRLPESVRLPANAVAEIRQTSILGEKYVALAAPTEVEPEGRLADGAVIPLSRSGRDAEIEEVLSALSALLNGGGVAQLRTISQELNNALEGREDRVRSLVTELDTFIGGLDEQRAEIVRALEGLDRLAGTLANETETIGEALDTVPDGLDVLADQRRDLTGMLTALNDLGEVGSEVINASRADLVANLESLQPILARLNEAGDDLPNALELLTTYPFPRNVTTAIRGDFVNLDITLDLDLDSVYGNLTDDAPELPDAPGTPDLPSPGLPDLPELPGLPDAPEAPEVPDAPDAPEPPDVTDLPGQLCPPVCTSGYTVSSYGGADSGYPPGVDTALAEMMTRGVFG